MPHNILRRALPWLALVVMFTLAALHLLWDYYCDGYYWYTHFPYYSEMPMTFATLALGNVWKALVPHNILLFRLLGWTLCLTAMATSYLTYIKKSGGVKTACRISWQLSR